MRLGHALFLLQNRFWSSYCQISTDLDKTLQTPIVVRNTLLWSDLDRDRRVGGSRPNQNDYVFVVILVTHKSYIETTEQRFQRQTVKVGVRTDLATRAKFRNFVAWAEPDLKTAFFAFLW